MKKITYFSVIFLTGFMLGNIVNQKQIFINNAHAEVAGMDSSQLEDDDDFKEAVEEIIEDCEVESDGDIDC